MKICFCVDSMNAGGAERVVSILSNSFVLLGHDVTLLMTASLKKYSFYNLDKKINFICLCENKKKRVNSIKRLFLLRKCFKKIKPDIIIAFLPHVCVYSYFASRFLKIPLIVSERNDPNNEIKKVKFLKEYVFKKADGCVFQTEDAKKYYQYKHKITKCVVIPNPISIDKELTSRDITNLKYKNEIISTGRLVEQKNHLLLVKAFAKFNFNRKDKYTLKIYGSGPLKDNILNYANNVGIKEYIKILSPSPNWLYDNIDTNMFVLTSNFEGMPNALAEALIAKIPCISTDCPIGGPKELIKDKINGLLIPVNDIEKLTDSINFLANNHDFAKKIANSNHILEEKLSVINVANVWLNFILALISDKN